MNFIDDCFQILEILHYKYNTCIQLYLKYRGSISKMYLNNHKKIMQQIGPSENSEKTDYIIFNTDA